MTRSDPITVFVLQCLDELEFDVMPLDKKFRAEHLNTRENEYILLDIAGKRRTIARHRPVEGKIGRGKNIISTAVCSQCRDKKMNRVPWPCEDMREIAAPFAAYVGYQPDWRPAA